RELRLQIDAVEAAFQRDTAAELRHFRDDDDLSELANGVVDLLKELGSEVDGDPRQVLAELRRRVKPSEQGAIAVGQEEAVGSGNGESAKIAVLWTSQEGVRKRLNDLYGPVFT